MTESREKVWECFAVLTKSRENESEDWFKEQLLSEHQQCVVFATAVACTPSRRSGSAKLMLYLKQLALSAGCVDT